MWSSGAELEGDYKSDKGVNCNRDTDPVTEADLPPAKSKSITAVDVNFLSNAGISTLKNRYNLALPREIVLLEVEMVP